MNRENKRNLSYNGWANYPTWFLSLDIIEVLAEDAMSQGITVDEYDVENWVNEVIEKPRDPMAQEALDYFLGEVDYRELADAINDMIS